MNRPATSGVGPSRKPGRPRSSATPDAIRRAAESLFAERGFTRTTVRAIANLADTSPAVVIRHFGSKEQLFLEVVTVELHLRGLVDGPLPTLGRQILHRLLGADGTTLRRHGTLLSALDQTEVRRYLTQAAAQHIIDPLAARLLGPDAEVRARLVAAQIGGLLMSMCLFDDTATHVLAAGALDYYATPIQVLIDGSQPD